MTKSFALACFFFLCLSQLAFAQAWIETKKFGNEGDDYFEAIVTDNQGNIYIAGSMDPRDEPFQLGDSMVVVIGGFMAKLDKHGKLLWLSDYIWDRYIKSLCVDKAGNLYAVGSAEPNYSTPLLQKFDTDGKLLWERTIHSKEYGSANRVKVDEHGNVYITGIVLNDRLETFVSKYNAIGDLQWQKFSLGMAYHGAYSETRGLAIDPSGNILTTSYTSILETQIKKYSPDGEEMWRIDVTGELYSNDIQADNEGNWYLTGMYDSQQAPVSIGSHPLHSTGWYDVFVAKISHNGNLKWVKQAGGDNLDRAFSIQVGKEGVYLTGTIIGAARFENKTFNYSSSPYIFVAKYTRNGALDWVTTSPEGNLRMTEYTPLTPTLSAINDQGMFYLAGTAMGNNNDIFYSLMADGNVQTYPNQIKGRITVSSGENCDPNDAGLANYLIKVEPGPYYGLSDVDGNFTIRTETGQFQVTQVLPQKNGLLVEQVCPQSFLSYPVSFDATNHTVEGINFSNQVSHQPFLRVDISADRRRRCFRNTTTVRYCNNGYSTASNVQVQVVYPTYVLPISATAAYSEKASILTFDIGTLAAGACGTITITDSVMCGNESIRGLTQCVKAYITPTNVKKTDTRWDHSDVTLNAVCRNNGFVRLTLRNSGTGNMADSAAYRIYLDAQQVFEAKYRLTRGDSLQLEVPANGRTVRFEADLRPFHPDTGRQPSITLEGCGGSSLAAARRGYVTQLPADDVPEEVAEICLPILDSYDPNDKQASPQGAGNQHIIQPGQDLDYLIRFQNTGTDLAYTVTIIDTLDENLDIATLAIGAASHPFQYSITGKGKSIITWTFTNINLPDSTRNESESHGFVRFRTSQKEDLPLGTSLINQAAIFFDYNSPVLTNRTIHTIGKIPVNTTLSLPIDVCQGNYPSQAHAGSNQQLQNISSVTLHGNQPLKGHGKWILVRGRGTILEPENPQTIVQDIGSGENIFEWTITLCDSVSRSRLTVERTINLPVPEVTGITAYCSGETILPITAKGQNLRWFADEKLTYPIGEGTSYLPIITQTDTFFVTQTAYEYQSEPATVIIRIHPIVPSPIVVNSDHLYCHGESIDPLIATGENIRWYSDAAYTLPLATGNIFHPMIETTDTVYVTQTIDACESVAQLIVLRQQPHQFQFTANGDTLVAPLSDTYQWFLNEKPITNANQQQYVAKNTGLYKVVIKRESCIASSTEVYHSVQVTTSTLIISPNPGVNQVLLEFSSKNEGVVELRLYSSLGKQISNVILQKNNTVLAHTFEVQILPAGIYLIELITEEGVKSVKLLKL